MEYGLIGAKLGHSYSNIIHEAVCGYSYELHPLPTEEEAHAFMQAKAFKAINVTIPYKKLVFPYCYEVEPRAAAIGAVNTVVNRDGKLYGYNTDYTGFAYLARCHGVKFAGAVVLVLGTGGASQAVQYALAEAGIPYAVVSRDPARGNFLYDDLRPEVVAGHRLIVNATPVGTFPHVDEAPLLPYEALTAAHYLFDLVYNPERTQFLLRGERQGARTLNGLPMLEAQAEASWRIWNGVI